MDEVVAMQRMIGLDREVPCRVTDLSSYVGEALLSRVAQLDKLPWQQSQWVALKKKPKKKVEHLRASQSV